MLTAAVPARTTPPHFTSDKDDDAIFAGIVSAASPRLQVKQAGL